MKSYQLQPTPRFQTRASIKIIPSTIPDICPYVSIIYIYIYMCVCVYVCIYIQYTPIKSPSLFLKNAGLNVHGAQDLWHHFRPIPNPSLDIIKNSEKDNFSGSKSCGSQLVAHQETRGCKLSQPFSIDIIIYSTCIYVYVSLYVLYMFICHIYILTSRRDPPKIQWNPAQLRCLRNV